VRDGAVTSAGEGIRGVSPRVYHRANLSRRSGPIVLHLYIAVPLTLTNHFPKHSIEG
jgi:hypothetical protein